MCSLSLEFRESRVSGVSNFGVSSFESLEFRESRVSRVSSFEFREAQNRDFPKPYPSAECQKKLFPLLVPNTLCTAYNTNEKVMFFVFQAPNFYLEANALKCG